MILDKNIFALLLLIMLNSFVICAQEKKYSNNIYSPSIYSLKAFVEGNKQSYPIIELNGDNHIFIEFDDFVSDVRDYSYQIIHCNYDWTVSDLLYDDYIDGFNENAIQDYEYSINTKIGYINYRVVLPNNDVGFKVSGNYVLKVYEDNDVDNTVLTVRFIIYEPIVSVNAEIVRPLGAKIQNNSQEVKLSINHEQLEISDPFNDVKVVITQNNRPDKVIKDIKPVFVRDNELIYSYSGDNIMLAGNEFRTFGFTNIHKYGINVNDIQFVDTIYHVQLRIDERRSSKRYFWEEEMNGKSIVFIDNSDDAYRVADYAYVYFSLPVDEPFLEGKVYVYGGLTAWKTDENSLMHYNFDTKMYEAILLLKQGYYDYIYVYYDNYTGKLNESVLEGSHYQTENDYLIFVYHRGFSQNYDRLVGYQVANSKYK